MLLKVLLYLITGFFIPVTKGKEMKNKATMPFMASLIVFIILSIATLGGHTQSFDIHTATQIQSLENPSLTTVMIVISNIGEWFVYIPIVILFLLIPRSRIKIGIPTAATLAVSTLLNHILKQCFAIPRPNVHQLISKTGYGFPSGHAMNGTAFIGLCAILFLQYSFKKTAKITILLTASLFLLLIGFSRIYLGVHNPSDVFAGYAAGVCLCFLAMLIMNSLDAIDQRDSERT